MVRGERSLLSLYDDAIEAAVVHSDLRSSVKVLGKYIDHHVKEEEGQLFPQARRAKLDLEAIGRQHAAATLAAASRARAARPGARRSLTRDGRR